MGVDTLQILVKNWWLLALCGVLDAAYAVTNLLTLGPDGSPAFRRFLAPATLRYMSAFSLAAGVCTIAAGVWISGRGKSWPLALNVWPSARSV